MTYGLLGSSEHGTYDNIKHRCRAVQCEHDPDGLDPFDDNLPSASYAKSNLFARSSHNSARCLHLAEFFGIA